MVTMDVELEQLVIRLVKAELEQYVTRLVNLLSDRPGYSADYLLIGKYSNAATKALSAKEQGPDFPVWLYRGIGDAEQSVLVENSEQEAGRLAEGFSRTRRPQPPSKFPESWVEVTVAQNPFAWRVLIQNAQEEALFFQSVDVNDWMRDNERMWGGGVGVGLDQIVSQHHAKMHAVLTEELEQDAQSLKEPRGDNL